MRFSVSLVPCWCFAIKAKKSRALRVVFGEWTLLGVVVGGCGNGIRYRSLDGVVFAPIRVRRMRPAEAVTGFR